MNTNYKLSIIIPAYNAEKIIEDCLNKIIQETTNIVSEIIVVNDCSTDDTLKILNKFKEIKVISLKKNMGVGYARNQGAIEAQYQMLCFIDSDIIIEKNSIYKNLLPPLKLLDETEQNDLLSNLKKLNFDMEVLKAA